MEKLTRAAPRILFAYLMFMALDVASARFLPGSRGVLFYASIAAISGFVEYVLLRFFRSPYSQGTWVLYPFHVGSARASTPEKDLPAEKHAMCRLATNVSSFVVTFVLVVLIYAGVGACAASLFHIDGDTDSVTLVVTSGVGFFLASRISAYYRSAEHTH
ncbi:hypothetical protein [Burkholderia diffusa]|uniref:hypothetical protein n=1 Tax=Burkholderia diffusa TaxID=488732 RepID=UPI00075898E7|nr:hypothetical protein [Burkholderia diffusa]KVG25174.1 hypothetical protein WJ30_03055 [Burkholderia diffusa]